MARKKLTAETLKDTLWDAMNDVVSGQLSSKDATAVARQAGEILKTVKTQVTILDKSGQGMTKKLIDFAKNGK